MSTHTRLLLLIAFSLAGLSGCGTTMSKDCRLYVIRPAINNDPILEGEALPVQCRDETVMKIMCARGEYEPASFVVETDQPLKLVMVRMGRLQGEAGLLAPETVDVRIARKIYRSAVTGNATIPWVLVHDPGMWQIVDGHPKWVLDTVARWKEQGHEKQPGTDWTIDQYMAGYSKMNRLTRPLIDTKQLQPADIHHRRQFWLTVHIPVDAPSGTYRAPVTISADNAPDTKLTL